MQKRGVIEVILLSFLTLGIYELYWLYQTRKELVARGARIPRAIWLLAPAVGITLVALMQFVMRFVLDASINATTSGDMFEPNGFKMAVNIISIIFGVIFILGIIPYTLYWFYKYCQGVELATKGKTSFALSFGSWVALSAISLFFIWPGIMQDSFNKQTVPLKAKSTKSRA
jgi:preprotein translocase subunit SecG